MQEQLDCQPFFKAPRVPPAETPGIPRPIADITADPGSPLPKQQAAQLDIFVDSFIDNIISAVKLELTAAALTVEADSDSTASATHAESSAPSTVQMKQNQAEADVEPIPAVSPSQPIAATQLDSSPPRQQAPVQSQQQSVAEAKPAPVTTTQESVLDERAAKIIEAEDIVQELVQGMLDTVIHNVGAEKVNTDLQLTFHAM